MKLQQYILAIIIIIMVAGTITLTACTSGPNQPPEYTPGTYQEIHLDLSGPITQNHFLTQKEYKTFAEQHVGGGSSVYYGMTRELLAEPAMMDMTQSAKVEGSANKITTTDYSGTNNQVAGVDEADILKTDGTYIYTLTDGVLYIIAAYPGADAKIISSTTVDGDATNLFIKGDRLAVFGNYNNYDYFNKIGIRPRSGMSFLTIYNISDKKNPGIVETYKFEGRYSDARMVGSEIYLVLNTDMELRDTYPTPILVRGDKVNTLPVNNIFYFDIPYQSARLVTVHAVNILNEKTSSLAVTVENSQTVYMSQDNIYIVGQEHISEYDIQQEITKSILKPKLTSADTTLIEKIKLTDNDVLSQREKESKIMQVYYRYISSLNRDEQEALQDEIETQLQKKLDKINYFDYSTITKIVVDNGMMKLVANDKVPGMIVNQFSLDEYKNNLRIATTITPRWSRTTHKQSVSTNNIWILDPNLKTIGELTNLAENERIYSTRFVNDRLYMVTFRQVDPFFVVDLSNPRNPQTLGKLKLPGFSRYLHPYDENHVIGIGQDTTQTGRTSGLKISLFDVTNVTQPLEVASYVTDEQYASSTALYEHKAFLFSKEKNLLVIPAFNRGGVRGEDKNGAYNGAFVFKITTNEIKLRGLIDHSMAAPNKWSAAVERSLYINDLLYTKSPYLLRINALDDLSSVKNITIESKKGLIPVY